MPVERHFRYHRVQLLLFIIRGGFMSCLAEKPARVVGHTYMRAGRHLFNGLRVDISYRCG